MGESLPAISGKQLIKLLVKDGWEIRRKAKHGFSLAKCLPARTLVTLVPNKSKPLPIGTLSDIWGVDQTRYGRKGIQKLIEKHGLK